MKKIIKRKLHISTYSRDFIDYINHEFYSHDKHNAFFEFTMEQLPTDNVVALFYFQKTKRYAEIHGVVEDNKVTIEFDTSLITTNETVCGYIYFEKVEQSADVCRFCFNVKVSEIDKLKNAPIVEKDTRRLIPVSEIVTKTELQELFKSIKKNGGTYNDTEIRKSITSIEERVQTLENKSSNSTEHVDDDVINRLNALEKNASSYLTEHQPLTSIEDTIKEIVKRFNNLSNIYLTSHQSLEHLATNAALEAVEQRVQQLEQARGSQPIVDNHDFVTRDELEELRNNQPTVDTSKLATNDKVAEVENRILALETKEDKDTVYNDEDIKRRLNNLENKTDNFISGVSVNKEGNNVTLTYNYVDGQAKNVSFTDSDTINIAYDDSALKTRLNDLENRPQIDVTKLVSKDELPNLIQHQPLTDYALKSELYNDNDLRNRVSALESKEDKNTVYNDEDIKRRLSNLEGKTDNFISGVSVNKEGNNVTLTYNYVDGQSKNVSFTDSDTINIAYDDSALKSRLNELENRPQVESYNDTDIKKRLSELEAKPTVDVSEYAKKSEVPTTDSVTNLLRTQGEQANKIQLLETKAGYEIHGTGMPNGKVTAPIGTTYVDTEVTNGALKWIKQTGSDNTGWKVIHGDTGWRNLKIVSQYGNSYVKIRRVNNNVMYHFGSLENGKFGMLGRNDVGVVALKGQEKYEIIIVDVDGIPKGFRTTNSIMGDMFFLQGHIRGIYHVRGTSDGNFLSFRSGNVWSSNPYIYNLMININYCTDDDWPTELPTV